MRGVFFLHGQEGGHKGMAKEHIPLRAGGAGAYCVELERLV